jgi:hypothetical protein
MKPVSLSLRLAVVLGPAIVVLPGSGVADPHIDSWLTDTSGQYVRLSTNAAAATADKAVTVWTYSSIDGTTVDDKQALPVYSGIQEIYSSSNYVYLRSSGMPAQTLGPLLAYAPANLILPTNQHTLFQIPRNPVVPTTKTTTGGGYIGHMVDGSQMFDIRDALSWNGTSEGMSTGFWTRDAYVNEGYGFDYNFGHSAPGGAYHYHANPMGLRYRLGDHMDFNPVTKVYTESTDSPTQHSPILGWVGDGFPVYGPYGYAVSNNAASGIRRMVSGFVLRNGQNGTVDLRTAGRTNIPPWAQRIYRTNNVTGPSNFSTYPLGRYLEDHDWKRDLINPATGSNYVMGVDYDLDEYNGRWCVTPEFPGGTYAYFVSITTNGAADFPYYLGRAYYGTPVTGNISSIGETVVTNFLGNTNVGSVLAAPKLNAGTVTLTWSAVEGGTYRVESSTNLSAWATNTSNVTPVLSTAHYTNNSSDPQRFYRVARTALASFDPVSTSGGTGGGSSGILSVSPTAHGADNVSFTLTINLDSSVNPPPQGAAATAVTVGSISGTSNTHVSSTVVTSSIKIPLGTASGPQTVSVTFAGPPGGGTGPTYTLSGGFSIN